jgi:hypothetical protein
MKISANEVSALRDLLSPLDTDAIRDAYREGRFPRSEATKDVNKRYRWDLFYHAQGFNVLTGEYNDSHIDTALRSIVPAL